MKIECPLRVHVNNVKYIQYMVIIGTYYYNNVADNENIVAHIVVGASQLKLNSD